MSTIHAKPGDPIQLGTCIGYGMDCHVRWGRLVGIMRGPNNIHKYVIRTYMKDDEGYPTGSYCTTSSMFLIPHSGRGCKSGEQEGYRQAVKEEQEEEWRRLTAKR